MIIVSWQSIYVKCWKSFHVRKWRSSLAFKYFVYSVCVCVFVFMCMRRPGLDSSGFSFFWRQSLTELRSHWLARVGSQWAPDAPFPTAHPRLGLQVYTNKPSFVMGAGDSNSVLLAGMEGTGNTESSPQWPISSNVHVSTVWMHLNLVSYPCHWAFTLLPTFSSYTGWYNWNII